MPFIFSLTNADRTDSNGVVHRTCSVCSNERVLTADNFYARAGRPAEARCQDCRRRRNAEVRRARAAGMPVRARRGTARKFGIEIECMVNSRTLLDAMRAQGLRCSNEGYTHRVMSGWKIVTDASVAGGYELVSPPLSGSAGIDQLRKACAALDAAGARVNRACGLHVHHDVSDLNADAFGRLLRSWSGSQVAIDQLVAPSRRGSNWAMPLRENEVVAIEQAQSTEAIRSHARYVDRYRSLNINCFPRYGTVEVRQHQGTCSFDKIAAWLAFGQAMITRAVAGADLMVPADADALLDELASFGLDADTVRFLKSRAAHFAGRRVVA